MDLTPLTINKDTRGSFIETFKLPNDGQVSYLIVNPHESRGNHYHDRKTERFVCIYGSAEISVRNRETGDVINAKLSGFKPYVVTVVPQHTHSITASDEGCIMLVWCDEIFNKKDPDTYPEEI